MIRARALLAGGLLLAMALAPARAGAEGAAGRATLTPIARTLSNGLRVVVFPRPGARVTQIQLQVAAGLRAEGASQDGLAYLTAQMLRLGTTSRSAADFQTELDTLGATLAVSVTRDSRGLPPACFRSSLMW